MSTDENKCKDCRWYRREEVFKSGECMVKPPKIAPSGNCYRPIVNEDDFCMRFWRAT